MANGRTIFGRTTPGWLSQNVPTRLRSIEPLSPSSHNGDEGRRVGRGALPCKCYKLGIAPPNTEATYRRSIGTTMISRQPPVSSQIGPQFVTVVFHPGRVMNAIQHLRSRLSSFGAGESQHETPRQPHKQNQRRMAFIRDRR